MRRVNDRAYIIATGIVISAVLICYAVNFYYRLGYGVSSRPEDWAALGDYFGGVLGPILTFISIVLLIRSLRLQNDANDSLRKDLANSEITEKLRSFEALFFGMIEAQKDLFKQLEIQVEVDERRHSLRGADAVIWLEDKVEGLREADREGKGAESVSSIGKLIEEIDVRDQIFGIARAFYIVVKLIIDRLSMERGFSVDDRKSHFLTLINFTEYSHLRLVLLYVQFSDYPSAKYLKESDEFSHALADVRLGFTLY